MKMLYWRVTALRRTNVLRKVPFFFYRRCCHIQMHDRKCWHCFLVAVGCERDEGDKVRNAFLTLHHVLLPWSILTLEHHFWLRQRPKSHVEEARPVKTSQYVSSAPPAVPWWWSACCSLSHLVDGCENGQWAHYFYLPPSWKLGGNSNTAFTLKKI